MPDWLSDLILAVGGGSVVLIGILTVFKKLFIKFFETGIESSFEKNIEKFKNKLERTTRAYEILLEREMRFYEKIESITAELIPLEHDLLYYLKHNDGVEREKECEKFREYLKRYGELIILLKNENLIHQSYIPQDVFVAFTAVIKQMQDDIAWWFNMGKHLFSGEYDKIDYEKGENIVETLLMHLAFAQNKVRKRLKHLSGEDE